MLPCALNGEVKGRIGTGLASIIEDMANTTSSCVADGKTYKQKKILCIRRRCVMHLMRLLLLFVSLMLSLTGCGDRAALPLRAGYGPSPQLPAPHPPLIPTINIAPAKGWPAGATPTAAAGLAVSAYATGLDHP